MLAIKPLEWELYQGDQSPDPLASAVFVAETVAGSYFLDENGVTWMPLAGKTYELAILADEDGYGAANRHWQEIVLPYLQPAFSTGTFNVPEEVLNLTDDSMALGLFILAGNLLASEYNSMIYTISNGEREIEVSLSYVPDQNAAAVRTNDAVAFLRLRRSQTVTDVLDELDKAYDEGVFASPDMTAVHEALSKAGIPLDCVTAYIGRRIVGTIRGKLEGDNT